MAGVKGRSGRKRTADKFARPIADAEKKIADRLPFLIDRQFELADGVWVEELDKEGTKRVYQRIPDRAAIEYLMNRIMGKPTERIEEESKVTVDHTVKVIKGVSMDDL